MEPAKPSKYSESQLWRSPVPYVFIGLAMVMGLIAIALIVLACSHRKFSYRNNNSTSDVESSTVFASSEILEDNKVMVVIMAGDDKPSFLAKPSFDVLESSSYLCPSCRDNQEY